MFLVVRPPPNEPYLKRDACMDLLRWLMALALTLFVAEGFTLSVFPRQFQDWMRDSDPRVLQIVGLVETTVAVGLLLGIVFV